MKVIKQLTDIYAKYNNAALKAWLATNINTNVVYLYLGIARGQWDTDAAASVALYGTPNSAAYRKIKFDLKAKLLSFMIFTEINQMEDCAETAAVKSLEESLLTAKLNYFQVNDVLQDIDF